jgi:aldehyde:ferredoxin oxidoreductase
MPLRVLNLSLNDDTNEAETIPGAIEQAYLGGRGLAVYLLSTRLDLETPPKSPENLLIFSAGQLASIGDLYDPGFVVSTRSPISGAIAHSWGQGPLGTAMRRAGWDALVLRGQCAEWSYLLLDGDRCTRHSAADLLGLDTVETAQRLRQRHGDEFHVAAIGPAGETGVAYASIVAGGRFAAEPAGTGVVMGYKRIKAIAVRGTQPPQIADLNRFKKALSAINARIKSTPLAEHMRLYGSTFYLDPAFAAGALSGRNGQDGVVAHFEAVSRAAVHARARQQPVGPPNRLLPLNADYLAKNGALLPRPDLETVAGFGTRCGITNLDALIAAADRCLKMGLDVVATSAALGFLIECQQHGLSKPPTMKWGDVETMLAALGRLSQIQEKRDVLSLGVGEMQEIYYGSEVFAPQIKQTAMPALDPRALPGMALSLVTSPIGGDYRYAMLYEEMLDKPPAWLPDEGAGPHSLKNKAARLIWHERFAAAIDSVGFDRQLALMAYQATPAEVTELYCALGGHALTPGSLARVGERIVTLERLFALQRAVNPADALPERWAVQPLKSGPSAHLIPPLPTLLADYYRRHGWNQHGEPPPQRLDELGLT